MNYESFEPLLGEWAELFRPFIESEEMDKIYTKLKDTNRRGRLVCPDSNNVFRAFKEMRRGNLKVIWYLQDPYYQIKNGVKVATGIAMDCSNTMENQPSLDLFYDGIQSDIGNSKCIKIERSPKLEWLQEQGVMFINSDLTTEHQKPSSHKGLWLAFQQYFIEDILNKYYRGLIFVLSGKNSESVEKFVLPIQHYIIKTEHPAAAAHHHRQWNTDDVFNRINSILRSNNGETSLIEWVKNVYDEVPF